MSDVLIGSDQSAEPVQTTEGQRNTQDQAQAAENAQIAEGAQAQEPVEAPKWLQNVPKTLVREEMKKYKSVWDYMQDIWKQVDTYKQEVEQRKGYVKPLTPDATEEDVKQFVQAMGIPTSPEEYEIGLDDKETADSIRQVAAKLFLTKAQAKELAKIIQEDEAREQQEIAEVRQKELQEVAEKVKQAYPADWNERVKKTNTVLRDLFGQDGMRYIAESGLGNKEWFVFGAMKLAEAMSEGKLTATSAPGSMAGGIDLDELYPSMKNIKSKR